MRHIASDRAAVGIDDVDRGKERYAFTGRIDIGGQSLHVRGTLVADPDARYALASPPATSRDQLLRDLMTRRPQKKAGDGAVDAHEQPEAEDRSDRLLVNRALDA